MIKSIHVRCFQSLRQVDIELGKLTVIVGSTNVGKSALIRAVKAVVENRRGDGFITTGYEGCQIYVDTGSYFVSWIKPLKKSGSYTTSSYDLSKPILLPSIVTQDQALTVLGIRKIQLSSSVAMLVNFQNQLDAPFLLAESDIVKSKVLGEITNASLILIAVNQLKRLTTQNQSLADIRSQDIATTKKSLEKYSSVDAIRFEFEQANHRVSAISSQVGYQSKLRDLEGSLQEIVISITKIGSVVHRMIWYFNYKLPSIYFGQPKIHVDSDNLIALSAMKDSLETLLVQAKNTKAKIEIIEKLNPDTTRVEQLMNQMSVLAGYNEAVEGCVKTTNMLTHESGQIEIDLKAADKNLLRLRDELRICPLCENPLQSTYKPIEDDRDHGPYCTESAILTDNRGDHTVYCGYLKGHDGPCDYVRAF